MDSQYHKECFTMRKPLLLILSGRMDLTRELISHLSYLSTSAAQILPYFEALSISDIQRHNPQDFTAFGLRYFLFRGRKARAVEKCFPRA